MEKKFEQQVKDGEKFEFGKNWQAFLSTITEDRIQTAIETLKSNLEYTNPEEYTFIDVGSGSGLFSLAARKIGFKVLSFDFDKQSVECTNSLKRRYFHEDSNWKIMEGSALDKEFVDSLGTFDIVYSWGVLHHTGSMWKALENVLSLVKPGGQLFIAIYNDQGATSRFWFKVKKFYNKSVLTKYLTLAFFIPLHYVVYFVMDILKFRNPISRYKEYKKNRGMAMYFDWVDWIGGFPFEVATPKELFNFYKKRGYTLTELTTTSRLGCNEFVFRKNK